MRFGVFIHFRSPFRLIRALLSSKEPLAGVKPTIPRPGMLWLGRSCHSRHRAYDATTLRVAYSGLAYDLLYKTISLRSPPRRRGSY